MLRRAVFKATNSAAAATTTTTIASGQRRLPRLRMFSSSLHRYVLGKSATKTDWKNDVRSFSSLHDSSETVDPAGFSSTLLSQPNTTEETTCNDNDNTSKTATVATTTTPSSGFTDPIEQPITTRTPLSMTDQIRKQHQLRYPAFVPPDNDVAKTIVQQFCKLLPLDTWHTLHEALNSARKNIVGSNVQFKVKTATMSANLNWPKTLPPWLKQNFVTLIRKRNHPDRVILNSPNIIPNLEKHVEILMEARNACIKQPLLWSKTKRVKMRREMHSMGRDVTNNETTGGEMEAHEKDAPHHDETTVVTTTTNSNDNYEDDDDESPLWKEQRARLVALHEGKLDEEQYWEAKKLLQHMASNMPPQYFKYTMALFERHAKENRDKKSLKKLTCLAPRLRECAPRVAKELCRFFYLVDYENDGDVDAVPELDPSPLLVEWTDEKLNEYAALWMKCRTMVVQTCVPLLEDEGQSRQATIERCERAKALHSTKDDSTCLEEAKEIVQYLGKRVTHKEFRAVMDLLTSYTLPAISSKKKVEKIRFLSSHLVNAADSHVHLIATEVANFFYINADAHFVSRHEQLKQTKEEYEEFEKQLIDIAHELQEALYQYDVVSHNEDLQEDDAMAVECIQHAGRSIKPRYFHVIMDAIKTSNEPVIVPGSDRMVLLDNLPIDMTEMELCALYSRCGPIESIQIFNQRPDLDPGPLKPAQIREKKKKLRTNLHSFESKHYERPRTPVYAIIKFESESGYKSSMEPSLRLFGMVIQRHAVRTYRASDMNKLFIENIPPSWSSRDLEHEISRCLEPMVNVYLDLGANATRFATCCEINFPDFEVTFESQRKLVTGLNLSNRMAKESEETKPPSPVSINFLRNPRNAMRYWTRDLGFF